MKKFKEIQKMTWNNILYFSIFILLNGIGESIENIDLEILLDQNGIWLLFVSRGKGLWGTGREVGNRHVDGGMTGERGYVAEKLCI